ncbi:hypothetical protein GF336_02080 [Candidatus Woesearchaeota archaeon]|nr:hypothetical protein [Candidatus Woesearchaeota archaeon]
MYVFGVDIPLVELLFALGIFSILILLEITVVLILITYQMRNSKKLEAEINNLTKTLLKLEDKELKELDKLAGLRKSKSDPRSKKSKKKKRSKKSR